MSQMWFYSRRTIIPFFVLGVNVKPAKMMKKQPTLGELFRGTVLDTYIEAARVRPLTDFLTPKSWIQPILEYITEQTLKIGWAEKEDVFKEFQERGASETEVKQVLEQLEREGTIYAPREGFLKKT